MMPALKATALAAMLVAYGSLAWGAEPSLVSPKGVVLAFYKVALQDMKPAAAFEQYASPAFIEHSQDSAGGDAHATVVFLQHLIDGATQPKWEVIRTIAEGDLVFVHARYTAGPNAPEVAVAEIFRVQQGKIAEHWDVISGPPEKVINPNSRF